MTRLTFPILFILLALPGSAAFAQTDLVQHWTNYRSSHLDEKVFVHTDKDYYLSGELCWFKCYDVSASTGKPLSLSSVAYVEVLDAHARPVLQAKVGLDRGSGGGSFYLPFSLISGNYTLRAYTNWMKNQAAEYFFSKTITILNTREAIPEGDTLSPPGVQAAFFPEGGNLVNGLSATVAFQVTDAYGEPLTFSGTLVDDKGDTLLHFEPLAQGRGHFDLTPAPGRSYTALVRASDGRSFRGPLPNAYPEGVVMHLDTATAGQLKVAVHSTSSGGRVYLLVHTGASMEMAVAATLADGQATFLIDKERMGAGISHLTIFNEDRQPVCERLFFTYPSTPHRLDLQTDRSSYETRAGVSIRVQTPAGVTGPDLSITAYRMDSLQGTAEGNIYNYLWLSSELTGPVAHPDYYFSAPDAERAAAMDNLMLTQGWRRFRWEEVLRDSTPSFAYIPEYRGHIITGKIVDTRTGIAAPGKEGYLSVPGVRTQFATAISDSLGRVAFDMRDMYGSSEIIVQTNTVRDSMYRIDVNNPFSESYPLYPHPPFTLPLHNPLTLAQRSLSMQVQNAYAAMKVQAPFLPDVDTTAFYLHPDLTYMLDDYTRFTTMEEVLREYVQLVNVYRKGERFHLWAYNMPAHAPFDEDPFILLDGVPIFNTDQFMKYDPLKVRRLEVVTRRYFLGGVFFTGLLNWTTYHGNLSGYELDPHATALDYDGLQEKRTFYSPVYASQKASRLPDFRNVLYWSPQVPIRNSGEGQVRFFTSDLPGKYTVIVQGVSAEGLPLYGATTLEVTPPQRR